MFLLFNFSILPALPHGDTLHHQPSAPDVHGCVIHSFLHPKCRQNPRSLLEYCCIGMPIDIGENTILSNLTLLTCTHFHENLLRLPPNLIMQTIPLNNERFATFAFGFHENMKATYENPAQMVYFGQPLPILARKLHCEVIDLFDADETQKSFWTLKIFPVASNPNESLEKTLQLLLSANALPGKEDDYVSIKDILKRRDINSIIQYRSNLINCT